MVKPKVIHVAGGLTAMFKDRVVKFQLECARFNAGSNMSVVIYYSHFTGHLLSRYRRISECLYSIFNGQAGRYAPYRPA